jgi:hypothetical protein
MVTRVMTQTFSPSEAAFSVFELAKRQPQFVLRYCIIYALSVMVTYALAGATGFGQVLQNYVALTAGGKVPDPDKIVAVLEPASTGIIIMMVVGLLTGAITTAMGLRKAVRDEDRGLFGLEFGSDEINLLLAMMLVGAILFGVNLAITLVGGIASGGNVVLLFPIVLASLIAMSYVGIRFSQFGVLSIAGRRVAVVPSWVETKGQVWRFLGAFVLWIVVSGIISLIAGAISTIGAGALGAKIGGTMPISFEAFMTPGWLFYSLISGLVAGLANLGYICIGAYAWHQMRGDLPAPKPLI